LYLADGLKLEDKLSHSARNDCSKFPSDSNMLDKPIWRFPETVALVGVPSILLSLLWHIGHTYVQIYHEPQKGFIVGAKKVMGANQNTIKSVTIFDDNEAALVR